MKSNCDSNPTPSTAGTATLTPLSHFRKQLGKSDPTIWRWRKLGWIDGLINIAGKPYITAEGQTKFFRRAQAGEFSKQPHCPRQPKGGWK